MGSSNLKVKLSQYDITELALALKLTGKVNNNSGNLADFIDILKGLEKLFNCQVIDPYIIIHKLFNRKKNITPFIDNLKTKLLDEEKKRLNQKS